VKKQNRIQVLATRLSVKQAGNGGVSQTLWSDIPRAQKNLSGATSEYVEKLKRLRLPVQDALAYMEDSVDLSTEPELRGIDLGTYGGWDEETKRQWYGLIAIRRRLDDLLAEVNKRAGDLDDVFQGVIEGERVAP